MSIKKFVYLLIPVLQLALSACHKDPITDHPTPAPPVAISGMLYTVTDNGLLAYDLAAEKIAWRNNNLYISDVPSMAYDSGILYTGSPDGISAADATTGRMIWSTRLVTYGYQQYFPVLENYPVLKDSLIYFISFAQGMSAPEHPTLSCIRKQDGAILWQKDLTEGSTDTKWIYSTPLIINDKIIAVSHTENYDQGHNRVFGLNRFNGRQLWLNNTIQPDLFSYPFTPDSAQVLFLSPNAVYSLDPASGDVRWFRPVADAIDRRYVPTMQSNDLLLFGNTQDIVTHFDLGTQQVRLTYPDSIYNATIRGQRLYMMDFHETIRARDFTTNQNIWSWETPFRKKSDSITAANAWQYWSHNNAKIVTDDDLVYYYENSFVTLNSWNTITNSLYLVDVHTGKLAKEINIGTTPGSALLGWHIAIIKDGKMYTSTLAGNIN